jgi:hypothetical protein
MEWIFSLIKGAVMPDGQHGSVESARHHEMRHDALEVSVCGLLLHWKINSEKLKADAENLAL